MAISKLAALACVVGAFINQCSALVYNPNVHWFTDWKAAVDVGKKEDKPVMVIVYGEHCPTCRLLQAGLSPPNGANFEKVSKDFVLVATMNVPNTQEWAPDGGYVPRILFLKDDGSVDTAVRNEVDHRADGLYHYTYTTEHAVVGTMERVLEHRHRHRTDALHYNEDVHWIDNLDEALQLQKVENKPLMALFYSDHCPMCHKLRDSVTPPNGGQAFVKASKDYIMCMTKEPPGEEWAPDGHYVPRVLFVKDGKPDPAVVNHVEPRADGYHYTYTSEKSIVLSMELFAETQYGIGTTEDSAPAYTGSHEYTEYQEVPSAESVPEMAEAEYEEYTDTMEYNHRVAWESDIQSAIQRQKVEDKPMMVLFYGDHCPTCHSLADALSPPHGHAFVKVSKDFVMVKTTGPHPDNIGDASSWGPDGFYIPRVIFVKDGKADTSIMNDVEPRQDGYRYTYTSERALVGMMHKVLDSHQKEARELEF